MPFLQELKRRRVTKVAIAYAAVAWAVTEVSATVLPEFGVPEWTLKFIVICLIAGFAITMVMTWIFDVTPEGITRTEAAPTSTHAQRTRYRVSFGLLLAIGVLGLAWLLYERGVGPTVAAGPRDSVAVLPFANLSGDPSQDYFSDGMSEELLNLLAQVPRLKVAARTSSFAYKGQNVDVRRVARELGVDTVVDGSVRSSGDRIRITANLVDAESGLYIWSETYDRQLADIFAIQDEIAAAIVQELKLELGGESSPTAMGQHEKPPTQNVEAYQLYLQGRHFWKRRGEENIRRAIDLYQQAVGLDPAFARAHAAIAAAYVVLPGYANLPKDEPYELAVTSARQALALDPNIGEAHAVLAQINSDRGNWLDAEAGFFFATSLDPMEPTTHQWYSLLLSRVGRLQAAMKEAQTAYETDPTSPIIAANLANMHLMLGNDEEALRMARVAEDLGLSKNEREVDAVVALRRGDFEGARAAFRQLEWIEPDVLSGIMEFVDALQNPARRTEVVARMRTAPPEHFKQTELVSAYVQLGAVDLAMDIALAAARTEDAHELLDPAGAWTPEATPLRQNSRFPEVAQLLGLTDYWKQYGYPDACRPPTQDRPLTCG